MFSFFQKVKSILGYFFPAYCGGNSLQLVSSKGDSGHHFSSAKKRKWNAKEKEGSKKDYESEVLS